MRKFILTAALVLASASAQAGPSRGLIMASSEATGSTASETASTPKPPLAEPARSTTSADVRKTETTPAKPVVIKRETDEQKARRIAARYGISW